MNRVLEALRRWWRGTGRHSAAITYHFVPPCMLPGSWASVPEPLPYLPGPAAAAGTATAGRERTRAGEPDLPSHPREEPAAPVTTAARALARPAIHQWAAEAAKTAEAAPWGHLRDNWRDRTDTFAAFCEVAP